MKCTQGLALVMLAGAFAGSAAMAHPIFPAGMGSPKAPVAADKINTIYVPEALGFTDNYDSYVLGTGMSTNGTWDLWTPTSADGKVSKAQFVSAPHSFETTALCDVVQTGSLTSGKWKLTSKVYMPSSSSGTGGAWFIGLNTFEHISGPGTNNWSVQIGFDTAAAGVGLIGNSNTNSTPIPMVFDKWLDVAIYVDLDADSVWAEVDTGSGFQKVIDPPYQWSAGALLGGVPGKLALECWDFYSGGAAGFHYDDSKFEADGAVVCYPDCDESGTLDIDDFICFQTFFALGDIYADCDESGTLDIDDFICFQTFFAIGC